METSSLPEWAQLITIVTIALISVVVGVLNYMKTKTGTPNATPATKVEPVAPLSASFIDTKIIKDLIDEIRCGREDLERDTGKNRRAMSDLADAVRESTEVTQVSTDSTLNLIKFIRDRDRRAALEEH